MSFRVILEPKHDILRLIGSGTLTAHEIKKAFHYLCHEAPDGDKPGRLWDFSNATLKNISEDDIHDIVQSVKNEHVTSASSKDALLVNTDVDYGVARMVQTLMGSLPGDRKVCTSYDAAHAWLTGEN